MNEPISATVAIVAHYVEDHLATLADAVTEEETEDISHSYLVKVLGGNVVRVTVSAVS